MNWQQIRTQYPEQWLLIEAIEAHIGQKHQRLLDQIAVVEQCVDGLEAFRRYQVFRWQFPKQEYYHVHTRREELDIVDEVRLGSRLGVYAVWFILLNYYKASSANLPYLPYKTY